MKSRLLSIAVVVFLLNTGCVAAFGTAPRFQMGNALHLSLGLALTAVAVAAWRGTERGPNSADRRPFIALFMASAVAGLLLAIAGSARDHLWILALHIVLGVLAALAFVWWTLRTQRYRLMKATLAAGIAAAVLVTSALIHARLFARAQAREPHRYEHPNARRLKTGGQDQLLSGWPGAAIKEDEDRRRSGDWQSPRRLSLRDQPAPQRSRPTGFSTVSGWPGAATKVDENRRRSGDWQSPRRLSLRDQPAPQRSRPTRFSSRFRERARSSQQVKAMIEKGGCRCDAAGRGIASCGKRCC